MKWQKPYLTHRNMFDVQVCVLFFFFFFFKPVLLSTFLQFNLVIFKLQCASISSTGSGINHLPALHSAMLHLHLEIDCGGSIYTPEIDKYYKSGSFFFSQRKTSGTYHKVFDSTGLELVPIICISQNFAGDAVADGLGPNFENC